MNLRLTSRLALLADLRAKLGPLAAWRLIALLVAAVTPLSCSKQAPADPRSAKPAGKPGGGAPVPVLVTRVVEKSMPLELRAIGNVQAFARVAVRSRITGQVTEVRFQEGQSVQQGDLLFTIDPRPMRAALNQAEANLARDQAQLDNARLDFERQQSLAASQLISRNDHDKAEASFKALQAVVLADRAAIANATLNLEFTDIRSPIEGRTGAVLVHAGNIVKAEDDTLVTINQIRPVFVAFAVPEQHLAEIKQRMREARLVAEARPPNAEGAPARGELSFVDNAVDMATGTIQLKATFPNEDSALWPGQFVSLTLKLNEQPNSLVLPAQAVQNSQSGEFVFVVRPDQTVEMRAVKPGVRREGEVVVQEGLRAGETVVLDGQLRLVPGAKVSIKPGLMPVPAAAKPAEGT